MTRARLPYLIALAALLASGAAETKAKVVTAVYGGTLTSGVDYAGILGKPGRDLAGMHYRVEFTVDDNEAAEKDCSGETGCVAWFLNAPAAKAAVFLNNRPVLPLVAATHSQGMIYRSREATAEEIYNEHLLIGEEGGYSYLHHVWAAVYATGDGSEPISFLPTLDYSVPWSYVSKPPAGANMNLLLSRWRGSSGPEVPLLWASAYGNTVRVRVGDIGSPVPEPSGWAMMILGFALTGTVARSRGIMRGLRSPVG